MLQGAEKAHRPAELPRAATKAPPEAELLPRGVARLPKSHPLADPPLLALQAAVRPAAHWALAVHRDPGVAHRRAGRQEAAPPAAARQRAALPRAVPAADRAVVPPASNRRVRSQKVICAWRCVYLYLAQTLSDRPISATAGIEDLPAAALLSSTAMFFKQLTRRAVGGRSLRVRRPAVARCVQRGPARGLVDR
jgi:hypothetical protein